MEEPEVSEGRTEGETPLVAEGIIAETALRIASGQDEAESGRQSRQGLFIKPRLKTIVEQHVAQAVR